MTPAYPKASHWSAVSDWFLSETETDFYFGAMNKIGDRLPDKTIRVRIKKMPGKSVGRVQEAGDSAEGNFYENGTLAKCERTYH